jgi:hypothetical protein
MTYFLLLIIALLGALVLYQRRWLLINRKINRELVEYIETTHNKGVVTNIIRRVKYG